MSRYVAESMPTVHSWPSAPYTLRRGYNMGVRLIDEFLAKTKTIKCGDFRETAERIAKVPMLSSCRLRALQVALRLMCCSKASGPS